MPASIDIAVLIARRKSPLSFKFGNAFEDTTLTLNPNLWTQMTNIIFVDMPVGSGFTYTTTKEALISSDTIVAKQAKEFLRKGYILCSPLTDKFMDFNSRVEFSHRMALISDDIISMILQSVVENCRGDYMNTVKANSLCLDSLQRYEECTSGIDLKNILDPVYDKTDPKPSFSLLPSWLSY
ncbi:serine carboxypeptidase-like protein 16, partial [Tanacetum coccineum]